MFKRVKGWHDTRPIFRFMAVLHPHRTREEKLKNLWGFTKTIGSAEVVSKTGVVGLIRSHSEEVVKQKEYMTKQ